MHTCLSFLEHWEEFDSPDQMKRCVNIMHRIAVKLKTEGMFFRVRRRSLALSAIASFRG